MSCALRVLQTGCGSAAAEMAQHANKPMTLSMKFAQLKLTGIPEQQEIVGPVQLPHKAYLPAPDIEQPLERAPVPMVERRSVYSANYRATHNILEAGDGLPRRSLLRVFKGHMAAVTSLDAVLMEGREFLFSGSLDGTVRMYNVATGQCLHVFDGHTGSITAVSARLLQGGEKQEAVSRWIEQTLEPVWGDREQDLFVFDNLENTYKDVTIRMYDHDDLGQDDYMGRIELTLRDDIMPKKKGKSYRQQKWFPMTCMGRPAGKLHLELCWKHDQKELTVFLLAAKDLPRMDGMLLKSDPYVVISVKDQTLLRMFSGSDDKIAKMWAIDTGKVMKNFIGHTRPITAVMASRCFSENVLLTSSLDSSVRMWNTADASCMKIFKHDAPVLACSLNIIYEKGNKQTLTEEQIILHPEVELVLDLDFDVAANTKSFTVLLTKGKNFPVMDSEIGGGACDPFATVCVGKHKQTSNIRPNTLNPIWSEAFEFDDFEFDEDVVIRFFDHDAFSPPEYIGHVSIRLETLRLKRHQRAWFGLDFEPYSTVRLFTSGTDKKARMFDVRSERLLKTFVGHKGPVESVHLCDLYDKSFLFSSSLDNSIKLWDINIEDDPLRSDALPLPFFLSGQS